MLDFLSLHPTYLCYIQGTATVAKSGPGVVGGVAAPTKNSQPRAAGLHLGMDPTPQTRGGRRPLRMKTTDPLSWRGEKRRSNPPGSLPHFPSSTGGLLRFARNDRNWVEQRETQRIPLVGFRFTPANLHLLISTRPSSARWISAPAAGPAAPWPLPCGA